MIWDPSDANPLHRRIPAEVVSRRPRAQKKTAEKDRVVDEVSVDLKTAIVLKPDARPKWLIKACKMVSDGKASSTDLYDIIVNRRFTSGLSERISRKLVAVVRENLEIFSEKQQRFLNSNDSPITVYVAGPAPQIEEEEEAADAGTGKSKPEIERQQPEAIQSVPESKRQQSADEGAAKWQVVEDEAARRRQVAAAEERARQEAARREDRKRRFEAEEEASKQQAAAQEAARRRKLEEEVDNMFERALVPQPQRSVASDDRGRSRSVSAARSGGSRSISSRTARKRLRSDRSSRPSWRSSIPPGGVLSGSRAIFLSRDFQEDLPHLPRPCSQPEEAPLRKAMTCSIE